MSPSLESTAGSHNVRDNRAELSGRLRFIAVALGTLLVVVAAAFWFVQIVRGDTYLGLAENNRLRKQPLEAVRGLIFDHRGRALVENVPSYNLLLRRSEATDPEASLAFASHVLDRPRAELEEVVARYVRVPSFTPVLIAESLSLAEVARFEVAGFEHPEFEIEVRPLRLYRYGPQTAHVLGYLGQVTETEVAGAESPFRPGDLVGRRGIEKVYDPWLRGVDGEHVVVVDNRGKRVEEHHVVASQPGRDLRLTLDLDL